MQLDLIQKITEYHSVLDIEKARVMSKGRAPVVNLYGTIRVNVGSECILFLLFPLSIRRPFSSSVYLDFEASSSSVMHTTKEDVASILSADPEGVIETLSYVYCSHIFELDLLRFDDVVYRPREMELDAGLITVNSFTTDLIDDRRTN